MLRGRLLFVSLLQRAVALEVVPVVERRRQDHVWQLGYPSALGDGCLTVLRFLYGAAAISLKSTYDACASTLFNWSYEPFLTYSP